MATMQAALYSGIRQIGIHTVESLPPPPGYVQIASKQVGICGSDLHWYFGEWSQSSNLATGHETCGIITEVGAGVTNL
jgi:threonine dehydrogenase-like Zn-dependent dehydrogenase